MSDQETTTFTYQGDHITLGQLLKALNVIGSGGEVKSFLSQETVTLNGAMVQERGRKLREGDIVGLSNGTRVELRSR